MSGLLLDSQISPRVAVQVRRHRRGCTILSLHTWQDGALRDEPDAVILDATSNAGLTFVTYDCRTAPALLQAWAIHGRSHAGVLLVDERTIAQGDLGSLVRSLIHHWDRYQDLDLTSAALYLERAPGRDTRQAIGVASRHAER